MKRFLMFCAALVLLTTNLFAYEVYYTLTVRPSDACSVSPSSPQELEEGDQITITAYPKSGYQFVRWTIDGEEYSTQQSFTFTMPAHDVTIVAEVVYNNPALPGDPDINVQEKKDSYLCIVSYYPPSLGSSSTNSYEVGSSVEKSVSAITSSYRFVKWLCDGDSVANTTTYTFTMPEHDVQLVAVYAYDPTIPGDPDVNVQEKKDSYSCTVSYYPQSLSTSSTNSYEVGSTVNKSVSATSKGYRFVKWLCDGDSVANTTTYSFTMPEHDVQLVAVYTYDPSLPGNPNPNAIDWYGTEAELVIDDFTPGSLSSAANAKLSSTNTPALSIKSIVVAGMVNPNDFNLIRSYSECEQYDFSRTNLVENSSYRCNNLTNLKKVYLPETLEQLSSGTFSGCTSLNSVTCLATTPPALGDNVFSGVPEDMTVYVHYKVIPLYQAAEGWGNFTIRALREEVRNLEINLPEGSEDGRCKNMTLEVVNAKSGVRNRYIVSDRTTYVFEMLRRCTYNIYLRNHRGAIMSEVNGVDVINDPVSVTFSQLKPSYTVDFHVETPDGEDVTDKTSVVWLDKNGAYLGEDFTIDALTEGTQLHAQITLSEELASDYMLPSDYTYEVVNGDNSPTLTLSPFEKHIVKGTVKDSEDGSPIANAVLTATQVYNGKYSRSYTATTDVSGAFKIELADVPTSLVFSADNHVNKTVPLGSVNVDDLGTTLLEPIVTAAIRVKMKHTELTKAGEDAVEMSGYKEMEDLWFEVRDVTRDSLLAEVTQQMPLLVMPPVVEEGDELEITCHSHDGKFASMMATANVGEGLFGEVEFVVIPNGSIESSFHSTDNAAVIASLYNAEGKLEKVGDYAGTKLTFDYLPDGNYTLVSMGKSEYFNTIYSLSDMEAIGLQEGIDYVSNSVTVQAGKVSEIAISTIPLFVDSHLYYTGEKTKFYAGASNVKQGKSVTFTTNLDFKSLYEGKVSDIKLMYEFSPTVRFVDGSVVKNHHLIDYLAGDEMLKVEGVENGDELKFCLQSQSDGNIMVSAMVEFTCDGRTIKQPLGMATVEVASVKVSIPERTAVPAVSVFLSDIPEGEYSKIEIYDNGHLVAVVVDYETYYFSANLINNKTITCDLYDAYYYSWHGIQAKLISRDGRAYYTKKAICQYDPLAVVLNDYGLQQPRMSGVMAIVAPRKLTSRSYTLSSSVVATRKVGLELYAHFDYNPRLLSLFEKFQFILYFNKANGKRGHWFVGGYPGTISNKIYNDNVYGSNSYGIVGYTSVALDHLPVNMALNVKLKSYEALMDSTANNRYLKQMKAAMAKSDSLVAVINDLGAQIEAELAKASPDLDYVSGLLTHQSECTTQLGGWKTVGLTAQDQNNINAIVNAGSDAQRYTMWQNIKTDYTALPAYQQLQEWNNSLNTSSFTIPSQVLSNGVYIPSVSYEIGNPVTGNFLQDISATDWHIDEAAMSSNPEVVSFVNDGGDRITMDFAGHLSDFQPNSPTLEAAKTALHDYIQGKVTDFAIGRAMDFIQERLIVSALENQRIAQELVNACPESIALREMLSEANKDLARLASQNTIKALTTGAGAIVGGAMGAINGVNDVNAIAANWNDWESLFDAVTMACTPSADIGDASRKAQQHRDNYTRNKAITTGIKTASAAISVGGLAFSETVVGAVIAVGALGVSAVTSYFETGFDNENKLAMQDFVNSINNTPGCARIVLQEPITEDFYPLIDPSGYVYEAVSSNRLEGVTATIYHKDSIQDAYGDWKKTVTLWDAGLFDQRNPLYTDKEGKYAWDVPPGLWQVKFEKEGYETAYSEWLPVPPPQLDVNIGMVQRTVPEVKLATAYLDGVELTFDKYMDLTTINTDNIHLKVVRGEEETMLDDCVITTLNEEPVVKGDTLSYASKFRVSSPAGWNGADEVVLIVSRQAKSYAGVKMQEDFMQNLDISYKIREIVADTLLQIVVDSTATLRVGALPADASKGKVMKVTASSPNVVELSAEELTLDENGEAEISVKGLLEGSILLSMSVDSEDAEGLSEVDVLSESDITVRKPYASRITGTEVYRGQSVTLSSDTEGAIIYYTTDGSCPCEDTPSRMRYDGTPIVIDQPMTIRAMAVKDGWFDSEAVIFEYGIREADMDIPLASGWNWISHRLVDEVDVAVLDGMANRVVSQHSEAVDDPVFGFVGNLQQMNAESCYKVSVTNPADLELHGDEVDGGSLEIPLHEGWNWVGYPIGQVMSLDEALITTDANEGDALVGQEGFATYEDGFWLGTLNTLTPGKGYLYKSESQNTLLYDNSIVSVAAALNRHHAPLNPAPWAVDRTKYPNTMNIIAQLYDEDKPVGEGDYHVGAFCDTECRGIGSYVGGLLYLTIYGNGNETINLMAADCNNDKLYDIEETFDFEADVIGSRHQPYPLHIGSPNKVRTAKTAQPRVWPRSTTDKLNVRFSGHRIERMALTTAGGETVMTQRADGDEIVLHIGKLPKGIYILTVEADGKSYYYKVVRK